MEGWTEAGSSLIKEWTFKDFTESMIFVNKVAERAEKLGHHPDITISWNKVTTVLRTHDTGGLTEKDYKLAEAIDSV